MTSHGVLMSGLLNARAARLLRALHLTRIPPKRRSLLVLILVVSSREFPSTSSQKNLANPLNARLYPPQ